MMVEVAVKSFSPIEVVRMGGFWRFVVAKVVVDAVLAYTSPPLAVFRREYSLIRGFDPWLFLAGITRIFTGRCQPKIADAVIALDAVDVVYRMWRPFAVYMKPYNSMDEALTIIDHTLHVAASCETTKLAPGGEVTNGHFSSKASGVFIVGEKLSNQRRCDLSFQWVGFNPKISDAVVGVIPIDVFDDSLGNGGKMENPRQPIEFECSPMVHGSNMPIRHDIDGYGARFVSRTGITLTRDDAGLRIIREMIGCTLIGIVSDHDLAPFRSGSYDSDIILSVGA